MKKYTWIVALLALTVAFAFVACDDGDSSKKKKTDEDLPTVELTAADIVLKHCGNAATAANVDGNKFILTNQADLSNVGFYWEFPAEVKGTGYSTINIEMEVISIEKPDFVGLMTYSSTQFSGPVKVIDKATGKQKEGAYDYEFKLGVECEKGAAGDAQEGGDGILDGSSAAGVKREESYPLSKFTDKVAFQVNLHAGNITTAGWNKNASDAATFTIAVTKITFPGGKPVEEEKEEAKGGVLFDLADWVKDAEAIGDTGNPKAPLQKAGGPTLTVTNGALVVSGRTQDWHAIDLVTDGFTFDYDKFDYNLTVSGSLATLGTTGDNGQNILKAGQSGSPYNEVGRVEAIAADTVYTFTKPVPEKDKDDPPKAFGNIRIQTSGTSDYTITALKLEAVAK